MSEEKKKNKFPPVVYGIMGFIAALVVEQVVYTYNESDRRERQQLEYEQQRFSYQNDKIEKFSNELKDLIYSRIVHLEIFYSYLVLYDDKWSSQDVQRYNSLVQKFEEKYLITRTNYEVNKNKIFDNFLKNKKWDKRVDMCRAVEKKWLKLEKLIYEKQKMRNLSKSSEIVQLLIEVRSDLHPLSGYLSGAYKGADNAILYDFIKAREVSKQ